MLSRATLTYIDVHIHLYVKVKTFGHCSVISTGRHDSFCTTTLKNLFLFAARWHVKTVTVLSDSEFNPPNCFRSTCYIRTGRSLFCPAKANCLFFSWAAESAEKCCRAATSLNFRSPHLFSPSCPSPSLSPQLSTSHEAFHHCKEDQGGWHSLPFLWSPWANEVQPHLWNSLTVHHQVFKWLRNNGHGWLSLQKVHVRFVSGSLLGTVVGQVQRLLGGDAPIICFQTELVVAQSWLVEHWQPLHRVRGQGLCRGAENCWTRLPDQNYYPWSQKARKTFPLQLSTMFVR